MARRELHIVTGAFGYSGRYIAHRLLEAGREVRTLTNSPQRANPFGGRVAARPFQFDEPQKLCETLHGAAVLYNTYWVRFNHRDFTFARAVENSARLFDAAAKAGVGRVVHISITNPSQDSPLEYFSGKARVERLLIESGLSYAILRPAVLFGGADILVNNIAWLLRKLPVFGVFGDGQYRLQPIHVDDLADLAVREGGSRENHVIDAVGPQTFTYRGLVEEIGSIIGKRRPIVSVHPAVGWFAARILGKLVGDVILTRDEIRALMADLLCTHSPPTGQTRLTDWAREHAQTLGCRYARELARRRDRSQPYDSL